jgi:hypothetical protein
MTTRWSGAGPLIDREAELAALDQLLRTGTPQLALLTGRRRVGKTFLLSHAAPSDHLFLFTAARTTPEINRVQLLEDLARWSGEDVRPEDYPTWRTVFGRLLDARAPEPLVVILDEFQYLADDTHGLAGVASELNAAWERRRPVRPLVLVLCGSAVRTMEALAAGSGPLYGRFAWHHRLEPFDFADAARLAPFPAARDRALAYGIFGGTPKYLAALDPGATMARNVQRLLLDPTGEVRLLVETALEQEESLRDVSKYRAILRAVAGGCTERNQIGQRTGLPNDAALRDKLARLIELGYLETRGNVEARLNDPVRYGMADPAFRFHQRFVEPSASMLSRYPPATVWNAMVAPHLDAYMGRELERIVVQAWDRKVTIGTHPIVRRWGWWEGVDRGRESLEVDIVAELGDGRIMTGAVKWQRRPAGERMHAGHQTMLARAADAGRQWAHRALHRDAPFLYVAAGGFTPALRAAVAEDDRPITCWDLDDIYSDGDQTVVGLDHS